MAALKEGRRKRKENVIANRTGNWKEKERRKGGGKEGGSRERERVSRTLDFCIEDGKDGELKAI